MSPMHDVFDKTGCVYILASQVVGTLYIGVTSDLITRIAQHKAGTYGGFTLKHGVHMLVYYEQYDSIDAAIEREKKLKKWKRQWKIQLIETTNPKWDDLYPRLAQYELGTSSSCV